MNNLLLLRRRLMMQQRKRYKIDWYPIIQGDRTLQDMITEYGDLMQTFEDAPYMYGTEPYGGVKKGAMALQRDIASVQFGGNFRYIIIVYEDGEETARYYNSSRLTHTFNSTTSAKHVVFYNANSIGYQGFSAARWLILPHVENFAYNWMNIASSLRYLHIERGYSVQFSNLGQPSVCGYTGSVYYLPDWWTGTLPYMRLTAFSKLRLSKGTSFANSRYAFGIGTYDTPNLTDIYTHWGLGEVITQPFNRFTGQWKLHIPDLGNAELNAALVAEYRSKGWNYVSGLGIFNDVETEEPEEMLN